LGFKKRRERGREGEGKRVAKELFYPDTERRKKVEREPPRNAEGREKGSKKVEQEPPRNAEGGEKGSKKVGLKPPKNRREGGKRVTKRWIRPLEVEGKRWTKKVAAFLYSLLLLLLLTLFLLYD